ncbi:porin [Rhizobium sp. Rhizsp82]|uniref:porin n=1 Tax=Rhizobium sp. Rhizsp82 TaxID=3243057 RepID=UPI0039B454BD
MNIKSLLLGSAAALAAVSGAHAADAIVAAEPEAVEYVRVCDAYGTGYFYIPGTETCLKINGYIRFDVNYGFGEGFENGGLEDWNVRTRAQVQFTSKSDTEYGPLTGVIVYQYNFRPNAMKGIDTASLGGASNEMSLDQAYIDIAGLRVGKMLNWWDNDFSGEFDVTNSGTTSFNTIRYQYEAGSFYAGIAVEEVGGVSDFAAWQHGGNDIGIDAAVGGKVGDFTYELLGGYDVDAEDGAVRAKLGVAVGPGTLGLAAIWSSGPSAYFTKGEWSVAAQYAVKATDKFTITPGVQYTDNIDQVDGEYDSGNELRVGVTLDYQIVDNLSSKFTATYVKRDHDAAEDTDFVQGFFRLQRAF